MGVFVSYRTNIDWFSLGTKVLANGGMGEVQAARNRADAFYADQMTAPNFGNNSIDNTPVSSVKIPDGCTPWGGNYSTLFCKYRKWIVQSKSFHIPSLFQ